MKWIVALALPLAACASAAWDPSILPPAQYRGDVVTMVEFIAPADVARRCRDRGARVGPLMQALACANRELITLPHPCMMPHGGMYAAIACHEIGHRNGWPADHRRDGGGQ